MARSSNRVPDLLNAEKQAELADAAPPRAAGPPVRLGLAGQPEGEVASATSDAAVFTLGTYAAQGVLAVAGLIQKGLMGPVGAGFWALMQTFWTFFTLASLGAQHGATRQIPIHRGRGDLVAAARISNTAGTFSLLAIAVVGLLVAVVAIVAGGSWAPELRFGLVLLGVTAPLRFYTDVHETILASLKRFKLVSLTVLVKALTALTLQTLAVVAFGYWGMFLGLVAIELATLGLWLRRGVIGFGRPGFHWQLDRAQLRELVAYGAPILVYSQVWLLFLAVDSLVVAAALDVKTLGYYALAVSVTNQVLFLPKSIGSVLFPRMTERFGRTQDLGSIRHYATDTQRILAYLLVPLSIGAAFCLAPVLIRQALPAFEPAVEAVQVIVAASFFVALMNMPIKMLITAGYRWSLTALIAVCVVINLTLNWVAVGPLDLGLRGAAGATALSYLVTFLATTGFSLSRTMRPLEVVGHLAEIIAAFAYSIGALWLLQELIGDGDGALADIALGIAKLAAFAVLMLPWMWLAEKRARALTMLADLLRGALAKARSG
jgi:O-antigen/teichoic acid export membrane protein